jgi:hypothetical protein
MAGSAENFAYGAVQTAVTSGCDNDKEARSTFFVDFLDISGDENVMSRAVFKLRREF